MVGGKGFSVQVQEHMAGLSTCPFPLVDQRLDRRRQKIDVPVKETALGPHCASADKIVEVEVDIPGNPVVKGAFCFIQVTVVLSFLVILNELIYDFLF
jgi:hypothetical protein